MRLAFHERHDGDVAGLRARIDSRVKHYDERYPKLNLAQYYRWLDPSHARAEYRGGVADIRLGDRDLSVAIELPFFARLYKSRIESFVRSELDAVLRSA